MAGGNFLYTITQDTITSAGVYNSSGTLVRTLWSLKPHTIGNHVANWDGNDDFGNVATGSPFSIKVVSGNATYTWEGVVGNTSTNLNGNTVLRTTFPPKCLFTYGSFVYWAVGYGEAWASTWKTATSDLNSKIWINNTLNNGSYQTDFVCSDGTNVYWGALDPAITTHSFVYGTKVSDDTFQTFSSGVSLPQGIGPAFSSVINYIIDGTGTPSLSYITGLAVQQSGNFLFVTRSGINTLYVLNKTTGAQVQSYTITGAGKLAVDPSGNLWMAHGSVIEKYTVNASTGAVTTSGFTISLSNVGAIALNPAETQILAADMTAQQVKSYNAFTGALIFTLGTGVSYATSSTVQDNKFYWQDARGQYYTFINFLPDGTFQVGDGQNARIQHFDANGSNFIDSISYFGNNYYVYVDANDPTRLFCGNQALLEFQIDYSQPLADSWVLKNNWGGAFLATWNTNGMNFPTTLSNGKTYATVQLGIDKIVVELLPNGVIRPTNVTWLHSAFLFNIMDTNGDHIATTQTGSVNNAIYSIKRFPLTGFDGSNNPVWSASASTVSGTGAIVGRNGLAILAPAFKTANGNWIGWNPSQSSTPVTDAAAWGQGYHIGAIAEGASVVKWGSHPSTNRDTYAGPFPGVGNSLGHWYDSGNGVHAPGGFICASGNHVFSTYHGENWKQTQTNMFFHFYDEGIGLLVGSFGTNRYYDANNIITYPPIGRYECLPGSAGNALQGMSCIVNGITYVWSGDESDHDGVHRWKIENLDSVNIIQATYPVTYPVTKVGGIDLLEGLTAGGVFTDGVAGWNRSPTVDYNNGTGIMRCTIGSKNYDPIISPSLDLFGNLLFAPGNWYALRSLQNNTRLQSWVFSTDVLYDRNINTDNANHGNPLQILDDAGLVICQFEPYTTSVGGPPSFNQVRFNNNVVYTSQLNDIALVTRAWTRLTYSYLNGVITCTYGSYAPVTVSSPFGGGADMSLPSSLRLYMYTLLSTIQANGVQLAIQNTRFQAGPPKYGHT